jgi:hypothetical protein
LCLLLVSTGRIEVVLGLMRARMAEFALTGRFVPI